MDFKNILFRSLKPSMLMLSRNLVLKAATFTKLTVSQPHHTHKEIKIKLNIRPSQRPHHIGSSPPPESINASRHSRDISMSHCCNVQHPNARRPQKTTKNTKMSRSRQQYLSVAARAYGLLQRRRSVGTAVACMPWRRRSLQMFRRSVTRTNRKS